MSLAVFFHFILPERPEVVLSAEHDDYAWLTLQNHLDYPGNPELHQIVERLFSKAA